MLAVQWDPFHRCWNDLKTSLKQALGFPWRMVLSLCIYFNLSYGPYNSGEWFDKKKQMAKEFFHEYHPCQELFQSNIPLIAWEMGIEEPIFADDVEALWKRIMEAPHWSNKGPLVKLMRWLSFFQCCSYYRGDLIASRMVLEKEQTGLGALDWQKVSDDEMMDDGALPVATPAQGAKEKSLKQELAALKKAQGTFKLAPKMLTTKFIQQKDIVCIVSQAACHHHSEDARELLTAVQIKDHTVKSVLNNGWAQELVILMWC